MSGKLFLSFLFFTSFSYAEVSGYEKITGNVEDISLSSSSLAESVSDVETSYVSSDLTLSGRLSDVEDALSSLTDEVSDLSDSVEAMDDSDDVWTLLYAGTLDGGESKTAPDDAEYMSIDGSIYTISATTSQTLLGSYTTESCSSGGGGGGNVTCKTYSHYLYIKGNKVYAGSNDWDVYVSIEYK